MPTIKHTDGFRFFFYSNDHPPPHIHVEKGGSTAKYNLDPVELIQSKNFNARDLRKIRNIVIKNIQYFKICWNEHFNYS